MSLRVIESHQILTSQKMESNNRKRDGRIPTKGKEMIEKKRTQKRGEEEKNVKKKK